MPSAFRLEPGPVTLYAQLAGILRERIKSGIWPNGAEIPTLEELAEEFNVARVTVRQAMQILMKDGLVSSQRGRRTFVTYTPAEEKNPLFLSIDMVNAVTPRYEITIISRDEVPDSYLGQPFKGKPRGNYMRIRKIDYESGEPYSTSTHFVAMAVFALGITLGVKYRMCAIAFALSLTYVELLDKAVYLNHYYLACLLAWMLA